MTNDSEEILQFGTGRFLRAFVDRFVQEARDGGQRVGRIVMVQSQGDDFAEQLRANDGKYHVLVRGVENGQVVDRLEEVSCVSRAINAKTHWSDVLAAARSVDLRYVISNTTEVGYSLDPADQADAAPPSSFPAKLLAVLRVRHEAGLPGLTIIPCELRELQAEQLRNIVVGLARDWNIGPALIEYVESCCQWLNTLVDRIVVKPPTDHPIARSDPLAIMAEPFAFFALQTHAQAAPWFTHPMIVRTPDVLPYFLRKVRILNGAHTALLIRAKQRGYPLVRDAMSDPDLAGWLERLLAEEIVPTLEGRVDGAAEFARQTLDRFRNPFLEHRFSDIAQNHPQKVAIRLQTTQSEFRGRFGKSPPMLDELLALNRSMNL